MNSPVRAVGDTCGIPAKTSIVQSGLIPGASPAYTVTMNIIAGELEQLQQSLRAHPRLVVLTGAGISAGSGIPTYRDQAGRWLYSSPIQHPAFIADPATRQRYWTRSFHGWPAIRDASPNAAHRALAVLERYGHVELLITQNVDRLHQRAGSGVVIDLHGRLDRVRCLVCDDYSARELMQVRLLRANPALGSPAIGPGSRPDGDMALPDARAQDIRVPPCERCGGTLMPDVVFYGGSVPRARVQRCMDAIARADALLVIGSSLQVYSGFRFCRAAGAAGKPLLLLNPGLTRADGIASLKLSSPCEPLLEALLRGLPPSRPTLVRETAAAHTGKPAPEGRY